MPNHISNRITVKGSKEDIVRIFSEIGDDESPIDFNKVIPQPKGLYQDDLSTEKRKETAGLNWLDWNTKNWGCKWSAYSQVRLSPKTIYFETAWETPLPIFDALAAKYPSVEFKMEYADEDRGSNSGILTYKDGKLIQHLLLRGKEASKMLSKIRSAKRRRLSDTKSN